MAIYSLHHGTIGRTTHKPGTSAAHLRYITRESACAQMLSRLPHGVDCSRDGIAQWLTVCEASDRVNARVIDKLMVALPIELSREQRAALVESFCQEISLGRIPWIAAIHDMRDDAHNPHCHIILRDRDLTTGKRILKTAQTKTTDQFRLQWERAANSALVAAGLDARIDRRSFAARGRAEVPSVHLGAAEKMELRGMRTVKGDLNRRIANANAAYHDAIRIVQEAEAAAEQHRNETRRTAGAISPSGAWRERRELLLSEWYERSMRGHELARYWAITKTTRGLEFHNAAGGFIDQGPRVLALTGKDLEIKAMLDVARTKGWTTLEITGSEEFRQRVADEAIRQGFNVANAPEKERVAENYDTTRLLDEVTRLAKATRKGRQR